MTPPVIDPYYPPSAEWGESTLLSMGFWPYTDDPDLAAHARAQLQLKIDANIEYAGTFTGWRPLWADPTKPAEIRRYSSTEIDGHLNLKAGLLNVSSVTAGGRTLTQNVDYWLEEEGRAEDEPFTQILFSSPKIYRIPNQIVVSGLWGRFEQWSKAMYNAIIAKTAIDSLAFINQAQDIAGWSVPGFAEQSDIVGSITPKDILTAFGTKELNIVLQPFVRVIC